MEDSVKETEFENKKMKKSTKTMTEKEKNRQK